MFFMKKEKKYLKFFNIFQNYYNFCLKKETIIKKKKKITFNTLVQYFKINFKVFLIFFKKKKYLLFIIYKYHKSHSISLHQFWNNIDKIQIGHKIQNKIDCWFLLSPGGAQISIRPSYLWEKPSWLLDR